MTYSVIFTVYLPLLIFVMTQLPSMLLETEKNKFRTCYIGGYLQQQMSLVFNIYKTKKINNILERCTILNMP